jgi:BirA family biotin operon repressor/biotin-[acetyl-CoA-carboxylase] ligase
MTAPKRPPAPDDERPPGDDLDAARLAAACRGLAGVRECVWLAAVDSTQEELRRRGVMPGLLIVADRQTAGRGRRGRHWDSPPGGLWFSLGLRPPGPRRAWPLMTAVAGLALRAALARTSGLDCGIKWPNDLFCRGRKIAGILAESAGGGNLALGVGVNLAQEAAAFPAGLRALATSVRLETATAPPRAALLRAFLEELEARVARLAAGGSGALQDELQAASLLLGRRVALRDGPAGRVVAIDAGGALILETDASDEARAPGRWKVRSGEIASIEPPLDRETGDRGPA